jgi:hypothetical protein
MKASPMPSEASFLFEIYVEDDRYAIPTLHLVVAADDRRAREIATKVLHESAHHTGVEVRLGARRIMALGTSALPVSRRIAGLRRDGIR